MLVVSLCPSLIRTILEINTHANTRHLLLNKCTCKGIHVGFKQSISGSSSHSQRVMRMAYYWWEALSLSLFYFYSPPSAAQVPFTLATNFSDELFDSGVLSLPPLNTCCVDVMTATADTKNEGTGVVNGVHSEIELHVVQRTSFSVFSDFSLLYNWGKRQQGQEGNWMHLLLTVAERSEQCLIGASVWMWVLLKTAQAMWH